MTPSEQYAEWQTIRTIKLQAVATWMLRELLTKLDRLEKKLLAALAESELDGTASGRTQRAALKEFKALVDEQITATYRELYSRADEMFQELAQVETKDQNAIFLKLFGVATAAALIDTTKTDIAGATLKSWLSQQAGDLQFQLERGIQQGLNAGEDAGKLRRRIKGWAGSGAEPEAVMIPSPIEPKRRALETVIRTGVEATSQEVINSVGAEVPKSVRVGWQQISVLDARTTTICRAYAFKVWDRDYKPVGHNLPFNGGVPRHPNCRSRIVMFMMEDGPTKELTFKEWVDSLKPEQQKQIFGAERLRLWRNGKLSDQNLIRAQERAVSPEELKQ